MTDIVDSNTRSKIMSRIKGRDTQPELILRREIHKVGFRYRTHVSRLPGRPDLVFPRYRAVVFVHGCFWHRHAGCPFATIPATNEAFWQSKFDATIRRDAVAVGKLSQMGWRIATVWECELEARLNDAVGCVTDWLRSDRSTLEIPKRIRAGRPLSH